MTKGFDVSGISRRGDEVRILCGQGENPNYDMYCTFCFRNLFPDDPRTSEIHTNWIRADRGAFRGVTVAFFIVSYYPKIIK